VNQDGLLSLIIDGRLYMAKKETSDRVSSIAAKVLKGKKPTAAEAKSLAGSVLSQDETKGKRRAKKKGR